MFMHFGCIDWFWFPDCFDIANFHHNAFANSYPAPTDIFLFFIDLSRYCRSCRNLLSIFKSYDTRSALGFRRVHGISWKIDTFLHLVRKRYYENQSNKLNLVKDAKLVFWLLFLYWLKPYPESFHYLHFSLHLFTALNHEQTIIAHFF